MSELLRRAFIGLESDTDPLLEEGDEAVDAVVDTVEETAELEEVESGEGGITEIETAIHEVSDAAEALEEVTEFLETKQEEGGLSESDATMLTVATESIMRKFQGYLEVKIPATESFGGEGGRAAQTAIAIESFKDQIKKMWEAVKKFVMGLVEKITDWFSKHISVGGRLKKSAVAIAKKAGEVQETAEKIKLSAANVRYLSKAGDVKLSSLSKELDAVAKGVSSNRAMIELEGPAAKYTEAMADVDLSSVERVNKTIDGKLKNIDAKMIFANFGNQVNGDKRFTGTETTTFAYEPFPIGGKSQYLTVVTGEESWFMRKVKVQLLPSDPTVEIKEADVTALTSGEILKVCKSVEAIATSLTDGQKNFSKTSADVKKMLAEGDKLSKHIGEAPDDVQSNAKVKALKVILNAYSFLGQAMSTCQSQLNSEAANIGWAALAACTASLKGGKMNKGSKKD